MKASNSTLLVILVAVVGLLAVGAIAVAWGIWMAPIDQPIAFNHRLHIEEVGIECTDCHLYAETGVRATIPNIELCADCHAEAQTESAEEAKLVEFIGADERVPWRKIYRVDDHVYFSHRRHTSMGGIECQTCHGDVGSLEAPLPRPAVRMSMDFCMDCHYESGTSNDCLLCHR